MSVWPFVVGVVMILLNGFFVAVEFAVMAARRTRLEPLAEGGSRAAQLALKASRSLGLQLAGAQFGITVTSLILGLVGEPAVSHLLESGLEPLGLPPSAVRAIGFAVALTIVTFLHMVFGEMVPKNLAIAGAERMLMVLVWPNRIYLGLFGPLLRLLNGASNVGTRMLGHEPRDELATAVSAEEIGVMVDASISQGLIEGFEGDLLDAALDFQRRPVTDVMVPRAEVVATTTATPAGEIEQLVLSSGHSRLLVTGNDTDDVRGFIHAKDLLTLGPAARARPLPLRVLRRALVIAPHWNLEDTLVRMQRARLHFAVVVDEGRLRGLVTLEDVLEDLVGDLRDGTDAPAGS